MAKVIIFGGTTEGRELAEYAAENQIPVMVSVAGEYGSQLLGACPGVEIQCGRLDGGQMEELFIRESPGLVLDATHPHAVLVTENIRRACQKLGIICLRVLRDQEEALGSAAESRGEEASGDVAEGRGEIIWVSTAGEAARILNRDNQPVLLTTGSKELDVFLSGLKAPERIYARILPDSRGMAACEALGMQRSHVIAMQGPFSVEMNCALIRMTGAGWLVTKESGKRGGFAKKLKAAGICGIRTVVITRPGDVEGISLERAKSILDQFLGKRSLALVGMGMGGGSQLTAEAREVLSRAQAVLGAKRMLEDVKDLAGQARLVPYYRGEDIADWLEAHPECMRAVAVYSGDTGFHSGSASLLKAMEQKTSCNRQPTSCQKPQENGDGPWEIRVFPGISTVSCLCARFRISYEDLYLASAHGQVCAAEELVRQHRRVFLLLGGGGDLAQICQRLCESGYGKTRVMAGVRLGYADEQLLAGRAEEFCRQRTEALAAVILEYAGSGRREDAG